MNEIVKTAIGCYFLLLDFESRGHPTLTAAQWCFFPFTHSYFRHWERGEGYFILRGQIIPVAAYLNPIYGFEILNWYFDHFPTTNEVMETIINTIWDKKNKLDHIESICCWYLVHKWSRLVISDQLLVNSRPKPIFRDRLKFIPVGDCLSGKIFCRQAVKLI